MADVRKGAFYSDIAVIDDAPARPKFVRYFSTVLIAHNGHLVGSRPWRGGRALVWLKRGDWEETTYPIEQLACPVGDTIHLAIVINGEPEMCKSSEVPFPFDKWKVGGEKLPENPHAKKANAA